MKNSWLQHISSVMVLALLPWAMPVVVHAQASFPEPEAAAESFITALRDMDRAAMTVILGPDWEDFVPPEGVADEDIAAFLSAADEKVTVTESGEGYREVQVGLTPWTLPIPLVADGEGGWSFDLVAAEDRIIERRIGRNELSAMQAMLAYVDAQFDYAEADRNGNGVLEYARQLVSSPGQRDGLIWDESLGDGPLGRDFLPENPEWGYHGYRFRILTSQGPHANGGSRDYMLGGWLLTGFALVGWPVEYGTTGVMTFMVNHEGHVVERDLGPETTAVVADIQSYDPGPEWGLATP
jgi:hypothetical protein